MENAKIDALPPLRDVMQRAGIETKKSLGQNFLLDLNLTDKIARAAGELAGFHVIEVGPGPGGLTRALLRRGAAHVYAIEKDARCVAALGSLQAAANGRLTVIEGDALTADLAALAPAPRKVVANLPYNVATELLFRWLDVVHVEGKEAFAGLTLMFQKEVAARILAQPSTKDYGRLAVMAQWLCEGWAEFDIPPEAFTPPPKVTSTVVTLLPREKPLAPCGREALRAVLAAAFGQRRKMLRGALKSLNVDAEALLAQAGIAPTRRAEELSVEEFCALARAYEERRLALSSAQP